MSKLKLSRHLMEMKFMHRSKEEMEKREEELDKKALFESELTDMMIKEGKRFIIEPSYAPCEELVFGRMSFKGMNPEIEKLMLEKEQASLSELKKMDGISDKEMAERYSNLYDTTTTNVLTKRKRDYSASPSHNVEGNKELQKRKFRKPNSDW